MKPRGRGIPGLPSLDIPKAVAATLDEAMAGIRERHATLSKLTKFSPSSAYWRRLHMDIGVLLEAYDRQILLLDTVSPSTVEGAAAYVKMKARADRAEAALDEMTAMLGAAEPDDYDDIKAQLAAANERWAQLLDYAREQQAIACECSSDDEIVMERKEQQRDDMRGVLCEMAALEHPKEDS